MDIHFVIVHLACSLDITIFSDPGKLTEGGQNHLWKEFHLGIFPLLPIECWKYFSLEWLLVSTQMYSLGK